MSSSPDPHGVRAAGVLAGLLAQLVGPHADDVRVSGTGSLPSVYPVTDLATAAVAAAGVALRRLTHPAGEDRPGGVVVDRRLASLWFGSSVRPLGWRVPPAWDPVAGDYRAADGWVRLHTNVPAHRDAALSVLGCPPSRDVVGREVERWRATDLEAAVVAAGGCAAAQRTPQEWARSAPGRAVAAEPLVAWSGVDGSVRGPFEADDGGGEALLGAADDGAGPGSPAPAPRGDGPAAAAWAGASGRRAPSARPLAGLRVLDLTRVLAGPVATRFLGMLGADVLRVDPPGWDEPGLTPDVMTAKRSTRLDLRDARDRAAFEELLARADLLVHGLRPGALDGLGYGPEARQRLRPDLLEVSLSAYGHTGPWAGRRGFDSLVQMSTGIAHEGMRRLGRDRPTPLPVQALDHATGYLMAAAALEALAWRPRAGGALHARLSLARTAVLLTQRAGQEPPDPLTPEDERDLDAQTEQTGWGPARRLRPPLTVPGVELCSHLPARPLGQDAPTWAA